MHARYDLPVATLVISPVAGGADRGRADQLRLLGFPAWVAASDAELAWLMEHARVRPEYSLVDMTSWAADRPLSMLVSVAALARKARLPLVLVGAAAHEVPVFQGVIANLPGGADVRTIVGAMKRAAA